MLLDSRWAWLSNTNYPELGSPGTDLTQSKLNLEKFWGTEVRVFAFDSETGGGGISSFLNTRTGRAISSIPQTPEGQCLFLPISLLQYNSL